MKSHHIPTFIIEMLDKIADKDILRVFKRTPNTFMDYNLKENVYGTKLLDKNQCTRHNTLKRTVKETYNERFKQALGY